MCRTFKKYPPSPEKGVRGMGQRRAKTAAGPPQFLKRPDRRGDIPNFRARGLSALLVHGFRNAHHAGHAGNDHAEHGLKADRAAVVSEGVEQRALIPASAAESAKNTTPESTEQA